MARTNRKAPSLKPTAAAVVLVLGCILGESSIAEARYQDGMNLYQYVESNPGSWVDPAGTAPQPTANPTGGSPSGRGLDSVIDVTGQPPVNYPYWISYRETTKIYIPGEKDRFGNSVEGGWKTFTRDYRELKPCVVLIDLAHVNNILKNPVLHDNSDVNGYFALTCYGDVINRVRSASPQPDGTYDPADPGFPDGPKITAPIGAGTRPILGPYLEGRNRLRLGIQMVTQDMYGLTSDPKFWNAGNGQGAKAFETLLETTWNQAMDLARKLAKDCKCKCDEITVAISLRTGNEEDIETVPKEWQDRQETVPCEKHSKSNGKPMGLR